jgi:uncharacterized protein GlcG (DUF336 family)
MNALPLDLARKIISCGFVKSRDEAMNPLAIVVLDARGALKAAELEDGTSLMRYEIAHGKAFGALSLGIGSRAIYKRAQEQSFFVDAVNSLAQGRLIPVPGGVLIREKNGTIIGAVGVSGETSDNDEIIAVSAIESQGLVADAG